MIGNDVVLRTNSEDEKNLQSYDRKLYIHEVTIQYIVVMLATKQIVESKIAKCYLAKHHTEDIQKKRRIQNVNTTSTSR